MSETTGTRGLVARHSRTRDGLSQFCYWCLQTPGHVGNGHSAQHDHDPRRHREGRPRRARPGCQGDRPRTARRRHGGDLHRPPPDSRAGGRDGDPGGCRRGRHLDPLGRAHDARAAHPRPAARTRRGRRARPGRRHDPCRRHRRSEAARRGRGVHARRADPRDRRLPPRPGHGLVRIAVCVKAVPHAASGPRIDPTSMRLDRSGDLALSEYDTHALEEALRLREADGEGEVGVLSMGPEKAMDALRKGLAMGADRAVLVADDSLAGADLVATSKALAAALAAWEPDLVLFGQQSADGNGACLWAAVAERLGVPVVSQAAELTVADGALTARRQTEFGYETLRAPLPAVVAVSDAINEPRYPSLKGIMGAKSKPQEVLSASELGAGAASGTSVVGLQPPPPRSEGRRIEGGPDAAAAIVEFLAERRLL